MNDTQHHNPNDPTRSAIDWKSQEEAVLIRALADGELPADAEAALRAKLGDESVDRAMGFECSLRARCSAHMAHQTAPGELRERVVQLLQNEQGDDVLIKPDSGFWAGGGRALMRLAAVIALAATVWIIAPSGPASSEQFLQQATQHIAGEHGGCELNPEFFQTKVAPGNTNENPEQYIAEQIGGLPVHLELDEAGYQLAGVGGCHLPGPGKSVHLLYEPAEEGAMFGPVSLFIQDASEAKQNLKEGVVYTNGLEAAPYFRIWREGDVVYYMATSCPVGCNKIESAYALTGEQIPL